MAGKRGCVDEGSSQCESKRRRVGAKYISLFESLQHFFEEPRPSPESGLFSHYVSAQQQCVPRVVSVRDIAVSSEQDYVKLFGNIPETLGSYHSLTSDTRSRASIEVSNNNRRILEYIQAHESLVEDSIPERLGSYTLTDGQRLMIFHVTHRCASASER